MTEHAPDLAQAPSAADRYGIEDALHRYCHGIDRIDLEMLKSAFWEDGTDDHGSGAVPSHQFCVGVLEALKQMSGTMHSVSNLLIRMQSETRATTQSYCVAYHQIPGQDGAIEMVVGGRYLDVMEKRGGVWKIFTRVYVMDWNRNSPSTHTVEGELYGSLKIRGARAPNDVSKDYI